ncbi:MAG: hypothetical protein ACRBM6_36860, partial [Geminicoccales bacterium]
MTMPHLGNRTSRLDQPMAVRFSFRWKDERADLNFAMGHPVISDGERTTMIQRHDEIFPIDP